MWGPDAPVAPPPTALRHFTIAFSGFAAIFVFLYYAQPEMPAVRRDYPFGGLVKELGGLDANKVRLCSGSDRAVSLLTSYYRPEKRSH